MTRLYWPCVAIVFGSAFLILCGFLDERDARIAAESEARQIERAMHTACPSIPDHRVVYSIGYDGEQWGRWCGYYRTVIESVRITWERAQ